MRCAVLSSVQAHSVTRAIAVRTRLLTLRAPSDRVLAVYVDILGRRRHQMSKFVRACIRCACARSLLCP